MKIVITGGLGFVGQNLAAFIRRTSNQCTLHSVDWWEDAPKSHHELFDSSTTGCFAEPSSAPLYADADAIVHLAATTTVQESIQDPTKSFENNVIKTQKLLETIRLTSPQCHFVFASTGGAIIGDFDGPIDETIAPRPVSPYGATKLAVEGMLSAYAGSYGMKTAALRFSNVYGPLSARKSSVIAKFCKAYLETGRLQVTGDGLQTRDYIYVDDVCDAICRVLQRGAIGTFQLGTGVATSILDLIDVIQSVDENQTLHVDHTPALSGEVRHNVCNPKLANDVLGFEPKHSLEFGVAETLNWFQSHAA